MAFYCSDDVSLYHGDCRSVLAALPERSVQCVVTSPPYWGLRDYGIPPVGWANGETAVWGLEKTLESYIEHTLEVMDAVRRVLRDDGVIWWNLGDSYGPSGGPGGSGESSCRNGRAYTQRNLQSGTNPVVAGSKLLIPHRVAIALQDDGWCVRQDVVWAKKSPMPESIGGWRWQRCRVKVKPARHATTGYRPELSGHDDPRKAHGPSGIADTTNNAQWADCPGCPKCKPNGGYVLRRGNWRHTTGHEYVFMLTKGMGYFSDAEAVKEPATNRPPGNKNLGKYADYERNDSMSRRQNGKVTGTLSGAVENRNPRSVMHLSSFGWKEAHFATFPPKLVEPLLKAATSSAGCCPECGQCWAPVVEKERKATRPGTDTKVTGNGMVDGNRDPMRHIQISSVSEYRQTCDCEPADPVPCTVMDICSGSGTTGQVARHLGLRYIGIDCNEKYLEMSIDRINTPLVKPDRKAIESLPGQLEMF